MIGPWYFRFFVIFFFLTLAHSLPPLGWIIVVAAAVWAMVGLLYATAFLPRFLMDILDRLTNKPDLERKYSEVQTRSLIIDAEDLAAYMKTRIVGQDDVITSVAQQLRRRIAARRPGKPIAVFCFAGPPSVGKTYFAKVLAERLYGGPDNLLFFDMSLYGQPHLAASLFGQAKGYVGSNSYGSLTAGLRDFPRSVVLLDEFEKAHPEVHKRFLTAWNDGFITEVSDGARISTADAIFILTTNAASKKLADISARYAGSRAEFSDTVKKVLEEERFAPEVLSRIDDFFAFHALKGLDIARVVALEIEKTVAQYQLELSPGGIDSEILLQALEQDKKVSADIREMARTIEHRIADTVIDAKTAGARAISLRLENGVIRAHIDRYGSIGDGAAATAETGQRSLADRG